MVQTSMWICLLTSKRLKKLAVGVFEPLFMAQRRRGEHMGIIECWIRRRLYIMFRISGGREVKVSILSCAECRTAGMSGENGGTKGGCTESDF